MEEKILEVNKLLKQGYSLNQLDKENLLGYSRRAFSNKAKDIGYTYDRSEKQFIKVEDVTSVTSSVTETTQSKEKESEIKKENSKESKTKKKKEKESEPMDSKLAIAFSDMALRMSDLEDRLDVLEDIISNAPVKNNLILNPRVYEEEIKGRTMKVSASILDEFDMLCCEKHLSAYSKQAILGQALLEFIEKYK